MAAINFENVTRHVTMPLRNAIAKENVIFVLLVLVGRTRLLRVQGVINAISVKTIEAVWIHLHVIQCQQGARIVVNV
jgi:hypothetical protein